MHCLLFRFLVLMCFSSHSLSIIIIIIIIIMNNSVSAPTLTTIINTAPPRTAIAVVPTSAQTKCACTNFKVNSMMQHQDARINFKMLHIWDVMKTDTRTGHFLMRWMGGIIVRRIATRSVTRRGICTFLGNGGVNASVVMMWVCCVDFYDAWWLIASLR